MEPKNTLETLAALSAIGSFLLTVALMLWKVAFTATRWLNSEFTGRLPIWRFSSWNVKGNLKTGEFSINHLSESSTQLAPEPKRRKKAGCPTSRF
jgi:hypothetical protein